ncbi:hypothetical protein HYV50_03770 [Candidatus Pacearchaeota archaeon]|nr:hypothetical protein [Candidatus Pacearchaeota archaeon]
MIVKDSMVLIHLAKITLLEKSCEYFKEVVISQTIYQEIIKGEQKGYGDASLIKELVNKKKIKIKRIKDDKNLEKAEQYNIKGGEAEAVALYWQEKADYLATDDDNVRRKGLILKISIIGTPAIMISLYKSNRMSKEKYISSIEELRKIGWFSSQVIDKMKMGVERWSNQ